MHERVKKQDREKALQKRDHQLRGVSAVRRQDEKRDADYQTEEHLEIDLFFFAVRPSCAVWETFA